MILKYDFKLAETRAKSGGYTFRDAWGSVKVNIICLFVCLFELRLVVDDFRVSWYCNYFFYNGNNNRNNKSSSSFICSRKTCRRICSADRDRTKEEETGRW